MCVGNNLVRHLVRYLASLRLQALLGCVERFEEALIPVRQGSRCCLGRRVKERQYGGAISKMRIGLELCKTRHGDIVSKLPERHALESGLVDDHEDSGERPHGAQHQMTAPRGCRTAPIEAV